MAEEIRDIAEQEPEEIRLQIDETRSAITEKLEALEGTFVDTVQSAKDTVQETIDSATQKVEETISTVKETVQETVSSVRDSVNETVSNVKETFDLRLQVRRRPWPMLGGSLVAGLVAGALFSRARHRREMPMDRLESHGEPMMRQPEPVYQAPVTELRTSVAAEPHKPGVLDMFHDEIAQVKGLAIGMVVGIVRDVIKEQMPQMAEQVSEVMDNITTKLGGKPVEGQVLPRNEVCESEALHASRYSSVR